MYYVICPNLIMGPYETELDADKRRTVYDVSPCEWAGSHAVIPARSYKDAQVQQRPEISHNGKHSQRDCGGTKR